MTGYSRGLSFIEAYYPDGRQILGTMDGQAVIHAKNPERSSSWRRVCTEPLERISLRPSVIYKLVTESGKTIAILQKKRTKR
jgi:hypothetical protein